MNDYLYYLADAQVLGNAADENATNEINFGVTNPNVGRSGMFGAHIIVTTTFTGLDSGVNIEIVHGASTSPSTVCASRFFAASALTAGKHYFIPAPPSLLQYASVNFNIVSEVATAGACDIYFGEPGQGAE
jgi:hypothetical protein